MSHACWRKCDFQVHTPRDPNWIGARPIGAGDLSSATEAPATAEEIGAARADWAGSFVDACAARGLSAIALTDHNETVMVPYVQEAILRRQAKEPGFDLWLFPGMELTCQGGVQCLILFDADLTEEWRQQAQGRLGILYAADNPQGARAPKVTQINCAYPDIASALDEIPQLRNRYIVLPNVSNGGCNTSTHRCAPLLRCRIGCWERVAAWRSRRRPRE